MSWQDAPITQQGTPSVTPAWQRAPAVPASTAAPKTSKPTIPDQETPGGGFLDAGLRSIVNSIPNAANSVNDLINRVLPGTGLPTNAPTMQPKAGETSAVQGVASSAPVQAIMDRVGPVLDAIVHGSQEQDTALQQAHPMLHAALHNLSAVASDALQAAPVVAGGANALGAAIPTPAPPGPLGMVTGETHPIARNVAGTSARPAATATNQAIANPALGAQAGVPLGTKLSPGQVFEDARAPANAVYQRAAESLPTAPLSPAATQAVQGIGSNDLIVHSPDTVAQIENQKARLLNGPLTGPQVVDAQKSLRFNGYGNLMADNPDPEKVALGRAQLQMSDALQQHIADTLPPGAPVSADQLQAARVALAQNHTVENALGPNGNVNLQKLAQVHASNPGMLTGPMADIAQFAFDHPEVTSLPSKEEMFNPSGVLKDVTGANILNRPIGAVAQIFGGGLARRAFGPTAAAPQVPVTGLGGEFDALGGAPPENPSGGISVTPIEPKLGDMVPRQRGAVGAPTDIGALRKLMINPRTYTGMTPEETAALERLMQEPQTYSGSSSPPLGQTF